MKIFCRKTGRDGRSLGCDGVRHARINQVLVG